MSSGAPTWPLDSIVSVPSPLRPTVTVSVPMRTPRYMTMNREVPVATWLETAAWPAARGVANIVATRSPTLRWRASPRLRDIASQYRTATTGALALRVTDRGWLRFDGADRVSFLQALLTNDVDALKPLGGGYGLYLTPQGRLIADLELLHRGDHVLAGVPAQVAAELATTFDRLIFAEDVQVTDVSSSLATMAIVGARAAEIAASVIGIEPAAVRGLAPWSQIDAGESFAGVFIVQTATADVDVFYAVMPAGMESAFAAAVEKAGAEPASGEFIEALRIDAARPRFGLDLTTETIPLEAGLLDRAISQTKGCYVGQEVIIRVLHRGGGRVAKRLVQITAADESALVPPPGATLLVEGTEVGSVTSSAWSPEAGRARALGYMKREHAEAEKMVTVRWTDPQGTLHSNVSTITRIA
jgi:folate-binding protein YgfZ